MAEEQADELNFETALQELDETVRALEEGDLSLEDSLSLFQRGQELARRCERILQEATLRVEQLTADGEIVELDRD